jgi:hypothetical protein
MSWDEDIRARFPRWGTEAALIYWPQIRAGLEVGQLARGIVIARAPFGVWLDIGVGQPALLLVPEMREAKVRRLSFEDYPQIGEPVEGHIIALGNRGEISFSQHPPEAGN